MAFFISFLFSFGCVDLKSMIWRSGETSRHMRLWEIRYRVRNLLLLLWQHLHLRYLSENRFSALIRR